MDDDQLFVSVTENRGLQKVELGHLRNTLGYTRLGRWVLAEIAESLAHQKLGYFPSWLLNPEFNTEPRQHQEIWLYARDGSRAATLLDAVLNPFDFDVQAELDLLSESPAIQTDQEKLDTIRRIIDGP